MNSPTSPTTNKRFRLILTRTLRAALFRRRLVAAAFVTTAVVQNASAANGLLLEDAYTDSALATNYGASGDLRVFKNATKSMRAWLKFSLNTLPPGTTSNDITQARVRLWVNATTTATGTLLMRPVTSAWDEATLKGGGTATVTFGTPDITGIAVSSTSGYISVDVTVWVKNWLSGTLPNQGF